MRLDRFAMLDQRIGSPVQLHRAGSLEVHLEQLPQRAALGKPGVRRPLRGRIGQPRHDRTHRRRTQGRVDPQPGQQLHQTQALERPQPHLLDTDATRARQRKRIHIHRDQIARRLGVPRPAPRQELRRNPLCLGFDRLRHVVEQRRLAVEDLVDAPAQVRPLRLGEIEIAAEVQQGALAHLGAVAPAFHEAVGVVVLGAGTAGEGSAHKHGGDGSGAAPGCQPINIVLWHYIGRSTATNTRNQRVTPTKSADHGKIQLESSGYW